MYHRKLGLEESSFHLLAKPSFSRATMSSTSLSHVENLETTQQKDIFQATTQAEINFNYQKILLTYGKWNAEAYLEILKELNLEDDETTQPVDICPLPDLTKMKCNDINRTAARFKPKLAIPQKYENTMRHCKLHEMRPPKLSPVPEDSKYSCEPTYKKIFQNAKLKRKPRYNESLKDILKPHPSSKNIEKKLTIAEEPSEDRDVVRDKPCKLVKDGPNNYLLDVRRSKLEKDSKKVSCGSSFEVVMDDIERYYLNKKMQTVLDNNLEEQIELMKATLKSHVTEVSEIDIPIRDMGYKELKGKCLNDFNSIAEFQNMFDDSRWRKKFDLGKIGDSDDADSLDVSDIASSGSASVCSGDSLGTELDYKPKPIPPSRIPCIAEVREMGDSLFDKISAKWERAIKKNFLDPGMRPFFRHYSNAVRLRSTVPVFSGMMKLLEPYDDVYAKKYVPNKYRMVAKLEKMDAAQKAKDAHSKQLRALESLQIRRSLGKKSPSPVRYVTQEPTKYMDKNQRQRLKGIMQETKWRGQEVLTDWTKDALMKDYANLKPIIQTKNPHKTTTFAASPTRQPHRKSTCLPKKIVSMRSLRNFETSLFLRVGTSPTRSLSPSLSKSKLRTSSRTRMPI